MCCARPTKLYTATKQQSNVLMQITSSSRLTKWRNNMEEVYVLLAGGIVNTIIGIKNGQESFGAIGVLLFWLAFAAYTGV